MRKATGLTQIPKLGESCSSFVVVLWQLFCSITLTARYAEFIEDEHEHEHEHEFFNFGN